MPESFSLRETDNCDQIISSERLLMNPYDGEMLRGRTAIICEDEWTMATYLKLVLRKAGMRVIGMVADGESCVEEVLRKRPDLVLIDINLPKMDGTEAAKQIFVISRVSRPCVIMVTAFSDDSHRQEALDAGVQAYIVKPISPRELIQLIKTVMDTQVSAKNMSFPLVESCRAA